uniref:Asialoglycoprotein receptor 1 n=1 Tax=Nothobranchius pienaari TaxID=704102 RepID=A0A1A8QZT9_9TELE
MSDSLNDQDLEGCALWIKEDPSHLVSRWSFFRRWLPAVLMAAAVLVLIVVMAVTSAKTSNRLWSSEQKVSDLGDLVNSLKASVQQTEESVKGTQQLQLDVKNNKDHLTSVMESLKQLSVLKSLSRNVASLKCSLQLIINNSSAGQCCPLDWISFGSNCYHFSTEFLSWNKSKDWCQNQDAHLVILNSDQEWDFVTKHSIPGAYWVGLTDGRTGRWEWVNQTPYRMERRRWSPGQPDSWTGHGFGAGDEDCAHLNSKGCLNDLHCNIQLNFICQKRSLHS